MNMGKYSSKGKSNEIRFPSAKENEQFSSPDNSGYSDNDEHISPIEFGEIIMLKNIDEDATKKVIRFNRHLQNCIYCNQKYNAYLNIIESLDK